MNTGASFAAWLHARSKADALLDAWANQGDARLSDFETNALAMAALAGKTSTPMTVAIPSGRARLPLLAAVHAALMRLTGFPSPFSSEQRGPVALVTRQTIRRDELAQLDAAGVRVSPALNPVRLRADGRVAPLPSGTPRVQRPTDLLLLVHPSSHWGIAALLPSTVVIDAVHESDDFVDEALAWTATCHATPIVFADIARRAWKPGTTVYPCGWSAIAAQHTASGPDDLSRFAATRGHAAAISAGPQAGLAGAAALLAEARRSQGSFPPSLVDAAVLWRRLDELAVPLSTYDAACPRWHSPTLTERIEDIEGIRASDFPHHWRTWAETSWALLKGHLLRAADALADTNTKERLLVELVDADLRSKAPVDIATSSRVARDAIVRHLAAVGVPFPLDGALTVRSLGDPEAWGPPRATLLLAPPTRALRNRMVAADIGTVNVLSYDHELPALDAALVDALCEPTLHSDVVKALTPTALDLILDLPFERPAIVVSRLMPPGPESAGPSRSLITLADAVDIAGSSAFAVIGDVDESGPVDLPDSDDEPGRVHFNGTPRAAIPLTVAASGTSASREATVLLPVDANVTRILNGRVQRIQASEIEPGMLLTGLDGKTPFERLRPLLVDSRGAMTNMLLTAWEHALDMALIKAAGATGLAQILRGTGASITANAVAGWSRDERIGPGDAANVRRVGEYAPHPVVAGSAAAIAAVMRNLRMLHRSVGRVLATVHSASSDGVAELELLLGPDALSLVNQIVVWRVLAVGQQTTVKPHTLYRPLPAQSASS
jgi:hypothetical protein